MDKKLSLNSPGGLMLRVTALAEEGVYLIHEDDRWLEAPSNSKHGTHHLLSLTDLWACANKVVTMSLNRQALDGH